MDSILKAIESRNGTDPNPLSTMVEELEKSTAHEPVLSFVYEFTLTSIYLIEIVNCRHLFMI